MANKRLLKLMYQELIQNFEYIGAHVEDYIDDNKLFATFEIEDIAKIMKFSNLSTNNFITILKQAHSITDANTLYSCTRNANVMIQNFEEVISLLKSVSEFMKLRIFDGVIDFLIQTGKYVSDLIEQIQSLQTQLNQNTVENDQSEIITKIINLYFSDDFEYFYIYLNRLSSQGNKDILSIPCKSELWKKQNSHGRNVLHVASQFGDINFVKSLIECGCDIETKDINECTPLF